MIVENSKNKNGGAISVSAFVFLGNPGAQYENTRHNAGRLLARRFEFFIGWQKKFKGNFARVISFGYEQTTAPLFFLEPETFMNLSGESAGALAAFYKIPAERILVVHDELELKLGESSLKFGGGLGGHNGLRSIKAALGTADFWRLRIGIGRPAGEKGSVDVAGWVLAPFTNTEMMVLNQVLERCAQAVPIMVTKGPQSLLPAWKKITLATAA